MVIVTVVLSGASIFTVKSVTDARVSEYMLNHDQGYFLYRSLTALRDYVYLIAQQADDSLSYALRNLIICGIAWREHFKTETRSAVAYPDGR